MDSTNNNIIIYILCGQVIKFNKSFFDLYKTEPIFKETIDLIDKKLSNAELLGYSIWEKIQEIDIENSELIREQITCNTMLFMTQVSLYKLLKSKGINPDYIVALSAGEIAGSYISEMITLDMALYILVNRAKLLNSNIHENYFVTMGASPKYFNELVKEFPKIELSSHTTEQLILVSCGKKEEYNKIMERLNKDNIKSSLLFERSCFHHSSLENIKNEIINLKIESSLPKIKQISAFNSQFFSQSFKYDSNYLYKQMRGMVNTNFTIKTLLNEIKNLNNCDGAQKSPKLLFIQISPISGLLGNINNLIDSEVIPLHNNYFNNIEYYEPIKKGENMCFTLNKTISNIKNSLNL